MITDPDFDPLRTLNDLAINLEAQSHLTLSISQQLNKCAEQINQQTATITQLVEFYNHLNRRILELERGGSQD